MRLELLTRDLSLKLFSLAVALIFFMFVSVESATPVDVDVRIEYQLSDDLMLTGSPPNTLHATLRGPWAAFRTYTADDMNPVSIDLRDVEPGSLRRSVDLQVVKPPPGMQVIGVRPSELQLTVDRRVERQVPVSPDIPTRPAFGYEILDVRFEPPRVRVVGPLSRMQTLDFVVTRTIDVQGREEDLSIDVDLRAPLPPLKLVDQSRVHVLVEIGEEIVQRVFRDVPVTVDNAPKGARAQPSAVLITLKGPRRVVDKMEKSKLLAYVDALPEFSQGKRGFEKNVQLKGDLPERVQVLGPVARVKVDIPRARRRRR